MKRAKSAKRAGAKATIDPFTRNTGRDGAFDFASKMEVLGEMDRPPPRKAAGPDVAAFKKNAEQCARQAGRASEAGIRKSYEKLARSWRELAEHAEALLNNRAR